MKFSKEIQQFLNDFYPDKDIEKMNINELKTFIVELTQKRQEFMALEMAFKLLGNGAYGASASRFFYFYNVALAGDITGECRNLTLTMNRNLEDWFHEGIWQRKDLWEKFDFALDESKHDWYRQQHVWIYSDTDSSYVTYGTFFQTMTPEYQEKYSSNRAKLDWILKYNKEFQDSLNNEWCDNLYNPRNGHNVHEFELETVSYSGIYLKKKKYLKGLAYSKGKYFDNPKMSGTGIEIIKSTTPKLCREILTDMTRSLMFDYDDTTEESKEAYMFLFNEKLSEWRRKFFCAPLEDISQSVGIGDYNTYVVSDKEQLVLGQRCPVSVHAIARYNHLAYINGEADKKEYSGKIKYYNIRVGHKTTDIGYFGFPAGKLPTWAPPMDKTTQWEKTVIKPLNAFLEVMKIPLANPYNVTQMTLF